MTVAMTIYVLLWPVIVAGVLFVIARSFLQELLRAKKAGRRII
ncbi:putative transporter small subunit [Agrococcus sp. ProA11]